MLCRSECRKQCRADRHVYYHAYDVVGNRYERACRESRVNLEAFKRQGHEGAEYRGKYHNGK